MHVAPLERGPSGVAEPLRRAPSEVRRELVVGVELGAVPRRLLEVVPDDLVLLDELPCARRASRRSARGARRALPSAATRTPCRGSAGDGTETRRHRGSAIRSGRTSSLRTSESEPAGHAVALRLGCERRHRAAVEDLALRRTPRSITVRSSSPSVSSRAWSSAWIVGGTSTRPRCLPRERGHLLEEERVALGRLEDPRPRPGRRARRRRAARRRAPRARSSSSGSRRTEVAFSFPPRPTGADVEQLGPRDAEQEDRRGRATSRRCARRGRASAAPPSAGRRATRTSGRSSAQRFQQRARRELRIRGRRANRLAGLDPELDRASRRAASR